MSAAADIPRCDCFRCERMRRPVPPLPGMVRVTVDADQCCRCGHIWIRRFKGRDPRVCPKCKSPYWNTPRRSARAHSRVTEEP